MQPEPAGLCDAIFRALPVIDEREPVLIGLPDTIWFPADALRALPDDRLSFLLFPVERPELFDAVVADERGRVQEIQVKQADAASQLDLGRVQDAGRDSARAARSVGANATARRVHRHAGQRMAGARRRGVGRRAQATSYFDVGTMDGYLEAMRMLQRKPAAREEPHHDGRCADDDRRRRFERRVARTRRVVSEHGPGRRADRAQPFSRRLPALQVAHLRARHSRPT